MNTGRIMRWLEKYSFWMFLVFALCATVHLVAPTFNAWFNLEDFGSIRTGMVTSIPELGKTLTSNWSPDTSSAESNLGWSSGDLTAKLYRPLYALSFYPDWKIWGMNAQGYRSTNALLYFLCALSAYFLGKSLFKRRLVGLVGGLLYLFNPVHFTTLYVINYRSESLLAVFAIPAIAFWVEYRNTSKRRYLGASLTFLMFALFSKEQATALPFVFLAYDVIFHWDLGKKKIIKDLTLPIAGLVFYLLARVIVLHGLGSDSTLNPSYISSFPLLMTKGLANSFYYLIFGRADYLFVVQKYFWIILICLVFWVGGIYLAFRSDKNKFLRYSLFLALAYFLTIAITLPIFDLRFDFIPSVFFSLFMAYVLITLADHMGSKMGKVFFVGCLATIMVLISFWNFAWMDSANDVARASDYSLKVNSEVKSLVPNPAANQEVIFLTKPAALRGLAILGDLGSWLEFLYGKPVNAEIMTSVYAKNDFFQPITLTKIAANQYDVTLPDALTYTENNGMSGIFAKAAGKLLCYSPASNQNFQFLGVYTKIISSTSTLGNNFASFNILKGSGCSIRGVGISVKESYLAGSQPIYLFFNGQDMERVN